MRCGSKKSLKSESLLNIDGWKTIFSISKTLLNILHSSDGNEAFLNDWNLSGESGTSETISAIVCKYVELAFFKTVKLKTFKICKTIATANSCV